MKRAGIERQKPIVLELLDKAILREGFANYAGLAKEFSAFGKCFSKSSIHRYAQKLRERRMRAQHEAEILGALGDTIGWLVTWAKSYPRDAEALVRRLKAQLDDQQKRRSISRHG